MLEYRTGSQTGLLIIRFCRLNSVPPRSLNGGLEPRPTFCSRNGGTKWRPLKSIFRGQTKSQAIQCLSVGRDRVRQFERRRRSTNPVLGQSEIVSLDGGNASVGIDNCSIAKIGVVVCKREVLRTVATRRSDCHQRDTEKPYKRMNEGGNSIHALLLSHMNGDQ